MRKKLGLWEDGIVISFVGGINIRKGVHVLLEAFILIEKKYPDIKLLIVGPTYKYDQNYITDIKEKIKLLKLEHKITLTEKNVSNVNEYMQCSDIFVLPSRQEGFPISIVEAMSSGLAVIGSDIPEISNAQIINGVDGFLFKLGNAEELASIISRLVDDKEKMQELGKAARFKAISNWSTEIVDKAYKDVYRTL